MECKAIKELIIHEVSANASPEESSLLQGHLNECPSCQKEYRSYRNTWQLMGKARSAEPVNKSYKSEKLKELDKRPVKLWLPISIAALVIISVSLYIVLATKNPQNDPYFERTFADGSFIRATKTSKVTAISNEILRLENGSLRVKLSKNSSKELSTIQTETAIVTINQSDIFNQPVTNSPDDNGVDCTIEFQGGTNMKKITLITVVAGILQIASPSSSQTLQVKAGEVALIEQSQEPVKISKEVKERLEGLVKRLGDDDPTIRDKAQSELEQFLDSAAKLEWLKRLSTDSDPETKARVERAEKFFFTWVQKKVINGAELKLIPSKTEIRIGEDVQVDFSVEVINTGKEKLYVAGVHNDNWGSFRQFEILTPDGEQKSGKPIGALI